LSEDASGIESTLRCSHVQHQERQTGHTYDSSLEAECEETRVEPDNCWLRKFRATFAMMHLQAGVDLRTVMTWMGQTNLESVIRYLRPARHQTVREKVNRTFAKQVGETNHLMNRTA
jgi:integrase